MARAWDPVPSLWHELIGETDDVAPGLGRQGAMSSDFARGLRNFSMDAILTSIGLVALGEIGDKTQLLAIVLAAKFRRPGPIIAGIFAATALNHLVASALGYLVADWLSGPAFRIGVGLAFIAMAGWALIPDEADDDAAQKSSGGVFLTTLVSFFLVEIGDKTQIVTSLLAARFHNIILIATGTTLGMMLADIPAVLLGERVTRLVPLKTVRIAAAAVFALLGLWVLTEALSGLQQAAP